MTDELFDANDPLLADDPARDDTLRLLLRQHRLAERIGVAARRRGMRRIETPWYGWVARYGGAAVSLGVAAALIAAVILNRAVKTEAEYAAQSATQAAASSDLRGAVAGGSRSAVTDAVLGPDSTEFLIAMAVER
jgi:hypothetical protein